MRDGRINSVESVKVMETVECNFTLCYITVLIVICRIEKQQHSLSLYMLDTLKI